MHVHNVSTFGCIEFSINNFDFNLQWPFTLFALIKKKIIPIDYYEFLDEILQQLYQYKHDHYDYIFYLMSFKFSYIF
ncbi:hypothetical protein DERP_014359 [Dermatophagoides pteronyssinus]|uniref:Uncharacterized protein n=1 Tax=Dermatophagoides pteronyssinus TaxID=6956 RepID=A0ABQ8IV11_DERPT|nr:hypothetical protein DERP_014359 [Dermatophagoides pteronyssinus]